MDQPGGCIGTPYLKIHIQVAQCACAFLFGVPVLRLLRHIDLAEKTGRIMQYVLSGHSMDPDYPGADIEELRQAVRVAAILIHITVRQIVLDEAQSSLAVLKLLGGPPDFTEIPIQHQAEQKRRDGNIEPALDVFE